MKNYCLVFCFFLFCGSVSAQESVKKKNAVYLDFSVGASLPVGKNYPALDTTGMETSKAGFASTGMYFSGAVAFMGKHELGLGARYIYQHNNLKDSANHINIPDDSTFIGPGGWTNHYLLAGPFYITQIKKLMIDGQILGGVMLASSPVFSYMNPDSKRVETHKGVGFALEIRGGIGYILTEKMTIKATAGYLAGWPAYSKTYSAHVIGYDPITGEAIWSAPVNHEIKKIVSTVNFGIGLIFKI